MKRRHTTPVLPLMRKMMIVTAFMAVTSCLLSQSNTHAFIDNESGAIQLDQSHNLAIHYSFSLDDVAFSDIAAAKAHFKKLNTPIVTFRVDEASREVLVTLHKRQLDWSLEKWNLFLKEHTAFKAPDQ